MSCLPKICGSEPAIKVNADKSCNSQCTSNCFPFFSKKNKSTHHSERVHEVAIESFTSQTMEFTEPLHRKHSHKKRGRL